MSDNNIDILLVTADPRLIAEVEHSRPSDGRLHVAAPRMAPEVQATVAQCWVDLDAPRPESLPAARRYVYFASTASTTPAGWPVGVHLRKPAPRTTFDLLWSDAVLAGAAASPAASRGVPEWVHELHELGLAELTRRASRVVAREFGFSQVAIYCYDGAHQQLTRVDGTANEHRRPSVPIDAIERRVLTTAASRGQLLLLDGENGLSLGAIRAAQPTETAAGDAVGAPLAIDGRLVGLVLLTERAAPTPAPMDAQRRDLVGFLARSLAHALDHDHAHSEARIDGLTGLANYRSCLEALGREISMTRRFGFPLSLVAIDVDSLKSVNDAYGHGAGDCLLRHVADRIVSVLRGVDVAARTGGDEFVVALPSTDLAGAARLADRILAAIREEPLTIHSRQLRISASFGVAQWCDGWSPAQLIEAADRAMYESKRAGGARVSAVPAPSVAHPASVELARQGARR